MLPKPQMVLNVTFRYPVIIMGSPLDRWIRRCSRRVVLLDLGNFSFKSVQERCSSLVEDVFEEVEDVRLSAVSFCRAVMAETILQVAIIKLNIPWIYKSLDHEKSYNFWFFLESMSLPFKWICPKHSLGIIVFHVIHTIINTIWRDGHGFCHLNINMCWWWPSLKLFCQMGVKPLQEPQTKPSQQA